VSVIWAADPGGRWRPLALAGFPAEAALHDLVERAPQMLPLAGSPRLTVLGREVRLGGGSADLLAVESSGRLVIIEVKLAGSAEARRAVVAQVLSYAGYLQGLDPDQLESQVLGSRLGEGGSVLAMVEAGDQQHEVDPAAFRDELARSLADGSFRLVIVLDSAPDELVQVVGYLQSITDKIDIDLVTVAAYDVGGSQVLVPQRIEPGSRPRQLTDAQVSARQAGTRFPGSAEFRAAISDASAGQRDLLQRACDWAESLARDGLATLVTSRGRTGLVSLLPRLTDDSAGLVIIYRDIKSAYMMFQRSVFERRAPRSLAAVKAALETDLTSAHTLPEELLDALTAAYREAAQNG
jgi:hypothetical protein